MEAAGECFIWTRRDQSVGRKVWKSVVKEWTRGVISITLPEAFCLAWTPCLCRSGASRDCRVHQTETQFFLLVNGKLILNAIGDFYQFISSFYSSACSEIFVTNSTITNFKLALCDVTNGETTE